MLQTLEILIGTHFPDSVITAQPERDEIPWKVSERNWQMANRIVNAGSVRWAINSHQPYKAPGVDGIYPILLQNSLEVIISPLIRLFRGSLACGYVPSRWKDVKVIFIPKPGRSSYEEAKAYRPICLSSFLLKTMERMVERHLRSEYDIGNRLRYQHAYQVGRSCETALLTVVGDLERAIHEKEIALGAFLDIEGAFDSTPRASMERALSEFGVDKCSIRWIVNMLDGRKVQAKKGDCTIRAIVSKGCPQGGVLSPLLWSIVVNSLLERLNGLGFQTIGYADDIAIIIRGKVQSVISELMNRALEVSSKWCKDNDLRMNPKKTVIVPFTHKRKIDGITTPKLMGMEIQLEKKVKYLGVMLDSRLNWKEQISHVAKKATRALWTSRRLCGKTWGIRPSVMHYLYTAMVRPILAYGSIVWWHKAGSNLKDLAKVQRLACLLIGGGMKSTPTITMEAMFGLLPVEVFIESEAMKAAYRMSKILSINRHSSGHRSGFLKIFDVIEKAPELDMPSDVMLPKLRFKEEFRVEKYGLCQRKGDTFTPKNGINVFTDGSKTREGTGSGVWCTGRYKINTSIALGVTPTVFQAEIYGILAAAHTLGRLGTNRKVINIMTDSQAACGALGSVVVKSKLAEECRLKLTQLALQNEVSVYWIPGHQGILGNEEADLAARKGSATIPIGPPPLVGLAKGAHKQYIKALTDERLSKLWKRQKISHTKVFLKPEDWGKNKDFLMLSRRDLRDMVSIISGHCSLNRHMFNMKLTSSPLCRWCEEKSETPKHILLECRRLEGKRLSFFGLLDSRELVEGTSCKEILKFMRSLQLLQDK